MPAQPAEHTEPQQDTAEQERAHRHLHPVEDTEVVDGELIETTTAADSGSTANGDSTVDRARQALGWGAVTFSPDSGLYTDRQPSIEEAVRRARTGAQVPDAGPLRTAAIAHGYAYVAFAAVADTAKWIVAHPARLAVASALLGLALLFPPTREALSVLLTPFTWAQAALD